MAMAALTYHITWTTYRTWLPGDARGWVKWGELGLQPPDPERERNARQRMAESAVQLSPEQRALAEQTIRDHCRVRGWLLHAVRARSNHIHAVVTADRDPRQVMDQLKAWCSRNLSDAAGLVRPVAKKAGRRHWFTEGGNKELIDSEEYLHNAIRYVLEGQRGEGALALAGAACSRRVLMLRAHAAC
jgi:REP element-mobilizing transposase RayT